MTTLDLQQLLGPQGPVSRRLPGLSCAPRHLHLASSVAQALSGPHHLAVEAEPGTATRLAYLAAAIMHLQNGAARGIISTRSPGLQRRILEHDLPLLRSALPVEFSAASLKPRHHYLGLRRLSQTARRRDLLFSDPAHLEQLAAVQRWSLHSEDGSLDELAPPPALAVWDRVKSEHGNCLGHRCPRHESCFYYEARRRAQSAHLLVVSHATLLSDRALRQRGANLLPDYDFVVIDEGLALHAAACEHLGLRLSDRQTGLLLNALYDGRTGRGFLASCHADSVIEFVAAARQAAGRLFGGLRTWLRLHGAFGGCPSTPAVDNPLSPVLRALQFQLELLRDRMTAEEDLFELTALMDRCAATADLLEEILHQQREAHAYWISLEEGPGAEAGIVLHACPLEVRPELSSLLFQSTGAVVLVSPSLSLDEDDRACAYARRRLGLTSAAVLRMEHADRGTLEVLIEGHLPPPNSAGAFLPAACQCTADHLAGAPGPALVVVPSWPAARAIAGYLNAPARNLGVRMLGPQEARPDPQADHGISIVVDPLLEEICAPLDPVWQTLVLFRLPFEPAATPLVAARTDAIHARGGHAFREFQLPEALLRFKNCVRATLSAQQGLARLIILDQRMVTRRYGRAFLDTLPGCRALARFEPGGPLKSLTSVVSS